MVGGVEGDRGVGRGGGDPVALVGGGVEPAAGVEDQAAAQGEDLQAEQVTVAVPAPGGAGVEDEVQVAGDGGAEAA